MFIMNQSSIIQVHLRYNNWRRGLWINKFYDGNCSPRNSQLIQPNGRTYHLLPGTCPTFLRCKFSWRWQTSAHLSQHRWFCHALMQFYEIYLLLHFQVLSHGLTFSNASRSITSPRELPLWNATTFTKEINSKERLQPSTMQPHTVNSPFAIGLFAAYGTELFNDDCSQRRNSHSQKLWTLPFQWRQLRKILAPSKVMIHQLRRSRNSIDLAHTRPHSNPAIDVGRPTIQLTTANSRIPSITLVGRRATLPQSADLYACNKYTQGMQQRHQRNNLVQQDSFDSESEEYFMFKLSAPATSPIEVTVEVE